MFKNLSLRTALAGLLLFGLSLSALATTPPSTGLGQAWPNTTDVSASPYFHAYVFMLGGVEYVQVNDIDGNVLGAIGTANGQFITLPIGRFSQYVATPQEPAAITSAGTPINSPATVYQDASTTITATPLSNGAVQLNAATTTTCDPVECNSHTAALNTATTTTCDPVECNSHTAALNTATTTCDPVECNSHTAALNTATTTCDPVECNSHAPLSTAITTATTTTCDPVECNSHGQ
ncbi:MAG: hypothetical protein KGJ32_09505 [Xanthomonadaceae bacterium]|nr:hypothetical protein [Xanthomonadaceae bacterium]